MLKWPSIHMGSASMDSSNCKLDIFGKKNSINFYEAKLEFVRD